MPYEGEQMWDLPEQQTKGFLEKCYIERAWVL